MGAAAMPLDVLKSRATAVAVEQYNSGPGQKRRTAAAAAGRPTHPSTEDGMKKERKLKSAYVSRYRGTIYVDLLKAAIVAAEADNTTSRSSVAAAAEANSRLAAECATLERELTLLQERWCIANGNRPSVPTFDGTRVVHCKRPKLLHPTPTKMPPISAVDVGLDASPRSGHCSLGSTVSAASADKYPGVPSPPRRTVDDELTSDRRPARATPAPTPSAPMWDVPTVAAVTPLPSSSAQAPTPPTPASYNTAPLLLAGAAADSAGAAESFDVVGFADAMPSTTVDAPPAEMLSLENGTDGAPDVLEDLLTGAPPDAEMVRLASAAAAMVPALPFSKSKGPGWQSTAPTSYTGWVQPFASDCLPAA